MPGVGAEPPPRSAPESEVLCNPGVICEPPSVPLAAYAVLERLAIGEFELLADSQSPVA